MKFSNCEYVIAFNPSNDHLNSQPTKEIFNILMTYRFPMSHNPENKEKIDRLPPEKAKVLKKNPHIFISEMVENIDTNYQLIPIPKSLYQLFYMLFYLKEFQNMPSNFKDESVVKWNEKRERLTFDWLPNIRESYYKYCKNYINRDEVYDEWLTLNNFIHFFIKDKELTENSISILVKNLINEIGTIVTANLNKNRTFDSFVSSARFLMKFEDSEAIFPLINYIVNFEWSLQNKPYHVIYRGTSDFKSKDKGFVLEGEQQKPLSLSYSDGIFAGFGEDANTGMCFSYLVDRDVTCTAVLVSNNSKGNDGSNLFFVPTLPALATMNGTWEYHHPRSRIPNINQSLVENIPYGLNQGNHQLKSNEDEILIREFLVTPLFDDLSSFDECLRKTLGEKAIVVKDKDSLKEHASLTPQYNYCQITTELQKKRKPLNDEIISFDKRRLKHI